MSRGVGSYTLVIRPDDPMAATATVEVTVEGGRARPTAITVLIGANGDPLPDELSSLDFPAVVRGAVLLSQGLLPGPTPAAGSTADDAEDAPPPGQPNRSSRSNRPAERTGDQAKDVPSDLAVRYWRLGSVKKVAEHYAVPHHIARGWIRVLRKGGVLPKTVRPEWPSRA
jgi:hypothetical protein